MSQQINLYEARLRPRHELPVARNLGICTAALLVLMTALSLWAHFDAKRKSAVAAVSQQQLADGQEKLAELTRTMSERRVSPALAAELENAKAMLVTREEVMAVLDSGSLGNISGFSAMMAGFARLSQSDLWLTGFLVTVGGEEIEIRGRMLDPSKLPAYVQRLSSEPAFQGRRFAALEMRGIDPEDQNNQRGAAVASESPSDGGQQSGVPRLPHFVEFALRSENAGGADNAAHQGGKR